jgi:branched-chain amino acid transport system permease protein
LKKNIIYAVLLLLFVLVVPQIISDFGINLAAEIFIMAIFAMSLGLIMGYAGLDSLGHAAFFGIGAYTVALVGQYVMNTYLVIIIAVAIAAILAFITGAVFIRTSKFYFLMITLAFSQLVFTLFWQMKDLTGGADGMSVSAIMNLGFGDIFDPLTIYYVMGIIFVAVFILLRLFVGSPAGKITKGVMENESRMNALGYDVRVYKLLAYTLSGALAGFAGSLYAYYNVFVSPEISGWMFSGQVMIMVIVGGVGTLLGPAIGAGVFIFLQNFISTYTERWPMIMGALLIFLVLLGKGGIIQWLKLFVAMFVKKKSKNNVSSIDQPEKEEVIS